jgi:NADH:ubiquinone oxidoreductase subunit
MAATFGTRWFTLWNGKLVGSDAFGNRYFEEARLRKGNARKKRWVMYNGLAEPSKVPAEWHGWLHHTLETPPDAARQKRYFWQKPHIPNLTGTEGRYLQQGHLQKGGQRAKNSADYVAWKPE